jgi:hypothetical protein
MAPMLRTTTKNKTRLLAKTPTRPQIKPTRGSKTSKWTQLMVRREQMDMMVSIVVEVGGEAVAATTREAMVVVVDAEATTKMTATTITGTREEMESL